MVLFSGTRITSMLGHLTVAAGLMSAVGCASNVPEPKPTPAPTVDVEPMPEEKPLLSGIIVSSNQPTPILLNGEKKGEAPITIDDLQPGTYEVTFVDEENGNVTLTVELGEGEYKKVHHTPSPDASDARVGEE